MKAATSVRILSWADAGPAATAIREAVFVVEQGVPRTIELDEWDRHCTHALAYDAAGRAVGTGRLLPDGHVGRMAVLQEARGTGVGSAVLQALVEQARAAGMKRVLLNAQTHAAPFYRRHGFKAFGREFMEAGIPHVAMVRTL